MINYTHLARGLFNTPAALSPQGAHLALALRAGEIEGFGSPPLAFDLGVRPGDSPSDYDRVEDIAVIKAHGIMVQRVGPLWPIADWIGVTGYDRLRAQIRAAASDKKTSAIALDVDTCGGDVAECFDLVDLIYSVRGTKPVWAILGENAFSAGYAIASAADVVTVPRTGGTGSVGVIYMHVSFEDALKKAGIEVTLITKGDLKGEGSDMKNLSEDAFKRMKADVEKVGALFDATVARNRGMKPKAVFDTQAGTFLGPEGVDVGFADAVMSPDQAFRALLAELR